MKEPLISQSIIKEVQKQGCKTALLHYINRVETKPSEAMLCGLYFEHHLIGGCRGGQVPEMPKSKTTGKPLKAQQDLDILIPKAAAIMEKNNIVITEVQPEYICGHIVAHIDAIGTIDGEECIMDVKWTATRHDDKWNGWAEPENKPEALLQATHYVYTYYVATGKLLPFYFLIFGKSGWVNAVRFNIGKKYLVQHEKVIDDTQAYLAEAINTNFKSDPHFGVCGACRYKDVCNKYSEKLLPTIIEVD